MIQFSCGGCGKPFALRDEFAGRKAKCKACGASVIIPNPQNLASSPSRPLSRSAQVNNLGGTAVMDAAPPAPPKLNMRTRRLIADAALVREALANSQLITLISTRGEPPEIYEVEYKVQGLIPGANDEPTRGQNHRVRITLGADYPRLSPTCKMLTPIFHPNIDASAICVGDHWTAGERLIDLVIRIGEMIAYQAYNVKSPLDGQAAMWADLHGKEFPIDNRDLRPTALA